ncbi:hypothetical protein [Pseudomonas chlororaphis]|uniref:hypothetical protein n=1 Tax=Pseudomonas chlororaphis TaxID=587753 RepID=UPI0039E22B62
MPKLIDRLAARVEKRQGGDHSVLDTDAALHQQSVEEISRLTAENARLRKHIEGYRQVRGVQFLQNYAPYRDLDKPAQ